MLLQAIANEAAGARFAAFAALNHALSLAEPEGYVQTFVNEGATIVALLADRQSQMKSPEDKDSRIEAYVHKLLAACDVKNEAPPSPLAPQPLVEPLSPRELELLQLIAQGLSNSQISERLFIALSTDKGHNQRIFGKLQVQRCHRSGGSCARVRFACKQATCPFSTKTFPYL